MLPSYKKFSYDNHSKIPEVIATLSPDMTFNEVEWIVVVTIFLRSHNGADMLSCGFCHDMLA